jgi:ferredoxin
LKLKLTFGQTNVLSPVLSTAVLRSGVAANILEAKITSTSGEMVVDAQVEERELRKFVEVLKEGGVAVEELVATVEVDADRCVSCGACITLCPTEALVFSPAWELRFERDLCIGCEKCVPACPVAAIRPIT